MDGNLITFYILAFVAVGAALGMLYARNAVYSALFLIMDFAVVAVFFLMLGAPFIAMAQVTVYAGAIMVLFLFVIMLLGADKVGGTDRIGWQRFYAWLLVLLFMFAGLYEIGLAGVITGESTAFPAGVGGPAAIGDLLFNDYLVPFEVTSVLLLVAMIGAIVLTKDGRKIRKP